MIKVYGQRSWGRDKVYENEIGLRASKAPADFGTIVVKEFIGIDDKLKGLTFLYKIKGFNPGGRRLVLGKIQSFRKRSSYR